MALIADPILNSPFVEPARHFKFDDDGITNEILTGRRPSTHFVPIPRAKKKGKQLQFETEWTKDRIERNPVVDRIRQRVGAWRQGGYVGVTGTTSRLLTYWTREGRDKPLFFCQIEAVETAIYITEVARKYGDAWIENDLRAANDTSNPGLPRLALKMATGSGKTVVITGGDEPYDKLKRALRAEIDEGAWSTLYSTVSRPFAPPETGKIAVKVINHYGDEVLKVFDLDSELGT